MTELLSGVDAPSDAELISAVRGGDVAAYGELFSRHVEAARRLGRQLVRGTDVDDLVSDAFAKTLQVLQNGGGPDIAFRAYLLTSVRRLHVDRIRASKRVQPSDDMTEFDDGIPFQDTAVANFENGAAAKAFASLPERWQLVLWHLEVEGQKPADIAPLLGMSPNSVSALAYRAREGLRQAFLTMHLADSATEQCRWTNEHLGAFVRSGLSKRDSTKVQAHLDECRRCTAMYLELNEVNSNLAGIIAPLLLGAAAAGYVSSAGAGATGIAAVFDRIRDALTGNAGGGGGAATTTSAGGAASGSAATGGAAAAATGAAGAAASGAAVAAGSAATLGGILTVGGAIAAGVAVVTTAAFVVGGGGDKENVTEADRPPVVQTPTGSAAPDGLGGSGTEPTPSESASPSDEATAEYVVPAPGTATVDPAAATDTRPSSSPQDVAPPPAPAPADPAPAAPAPNDPAPNDPAPNDPGPAPAEPTSEPSTEPTAEPTAEPTSEPTSEPTAEPTAGPTTLPTSAPTTVAPPPPVNTVPSDPVTTTPPSEPTPPVRATSTQVTGDNVTITFDADEVPDQVSLNLASDPGGVGFDSTGSCTVESRTEATCAPTAARAASVFARAVPFMASSADQFTIDVPLDVPVNQPDPTAVTISYAVDGSSEYTPVTIDPIKLRIADVKLQGLAGRVQPDSAGTYRLSPSVSGLPTGATDPTGPVTFTLQGPATFAGPPAECTASQDSKSVTCPEVNAGAMEFDLSADPNEKDIEVILSVSSLDGFIDGDLENNKRTFTLAARSYDASIATAQADVPIDDSELHRGTVSLSGVSGLPSASLQLSGGAVLISATECEVDSATNSATCDAPQDGTLGVVVAAHDKTVTSTVNLSLAVPDGYIDPDSSDNTVTWKLQPRETMPTPGDRAVFNGPASIASNGGGQNHYRLTAELVDLPPDLGYVTFSFTDPQNHFTGHQAGCALLPTDRLLLCEVPSGTTSFSLAVDVFLPGHGRDDHGGLLAVNFGKLFAYTPIADESDR